MNQTDFYKAKLQYETDSWDLYEGIQNKANIVVIDARANSAYEKEHIPTAINFPHREMDAESTAILDKEVLYISYCDGIGCNASTKGALKLTELGFQVKELLGGLDWWKRDGYATEGTEGIEAIREEGISCAC